MRQVCEDFGSETSGNRINEEEEVMSGVAVLAGRMGALASRRVELRMRMAEKAQLHFMGSTVLDWMNQIAELSEEIGVLKTRLQAQVNTGAKDGFAEAGPGVPVDLRMACPLPPDGQEGRRASGARFCVECHEMRPLDENGRCGVCAMCVAGGAA
jgi:hypothetical protein